MQPIYFNGIDIGKVRQIEEFDDKLVSRIVSSLNTYQRMSMMIRGSLELGKLRMENWKAERSFFLFKCPVHGYQVTYPSGYFENLQCLPCFREELGLEEKKREARIEIVADLNYAPHSAK